MTLETRSVLVGKPNKQQLILNLDPSVIVFALWNGDELHFKKQRNVLWSSLEKILLRVNFEDKLNTED